MKDELFIGVEKFVNTEISMRGAKPVLTYLSTFNGAQNKRDAVDARNEAFIFKPLCPKNGRCTLEYPF